MRAVVSVLAFDCAGRGCAAAVLVGDEIAARRASAMERGQAEALLPMIEAALAEAAVDFAGLDLLACTIGPGAFTGLRIGLATARGLALATRLPLIGITSFAAVAAAVPASLRQGRPLAVALESKRAEIFLQCFAPDGTALGDGAQVAPEMADAVLPRGGLVLAGDAAERLLPYLARPVVLAPAAALPDPADIARLARAEWRPGERRAAPRPLYLRPPDTTLPRRAAVAQ